MEASISASRIQVAGAGHMRALAISVMVAFEALTTNLIIIIFDQLFTIEAGATEPSHP